MSDSLSACSVQRWLESAPQAYLMNIEYGHEPGEKEPELSIDDDLLHEQAGWQRVDLNALELDDTEAVLSETVLEQFKLRLGRIGIDYQTPLRP